MRTFGQVIKDARTAKGYTLERVALMSGTHKGYISGIERGKVAPPSPAIARSLAKALGLPPKRIILLGWLEKRPKGVTLKQIYKELERLSVKEPKPKKSSNGK